MAREGCGEGGRDGDFEAVFTCVAAAVNEDWSGGGGVGEGEGDVLALAEVERCEVGVFYACLLEGAL